MNRIVLVHLEGPREGKIDTFRQPVVNVGRAAECHLSFPTERGVSGHHARIEQRDGGFELVDNHSTNGSFVNEERVESHLLAEGDLVRFGAFGPVVRIEMPDRVVLAVPAAPPEFAATMALSSEELRTQMQRAVPASAVPVQAPRAPTGAPISAGAPAYAPIPAAAPTSKPMPPLVAPPAMPMPPPAPPAFVAPPSSPSPPPIIIAPAAISDRDQLADELFDDAPPPARHPLAATTENPVVVAPPPPAPPRPSARRAAAPTAGSGGGQVLRVWAILGGALLLGVLVAVLWIKFH